jgi:transcription elongation GreA/GreB family factor
MDKTFLVEQLGAKLRAAVQSSHVAAEEARADARSGAARAVNMAKGQGLRSVAAREALDALDLFHARPHPRGQPIALGAVVEIEGELGGKTLFIAPVCGGEELTGPDGDGIFQVVTPASPIGRALMGKRAGAEIEITVNGEPTDWTITYVG